jgi:hypothetical protein
MPPFDHQTEFPLLSEEDGRLGTLFDKADHLAGNCELQDRFLTSLSAADRAVVEESLIIANALRLLAQEATPSMSGRARARIQRMLYGDLDPIADDGIRDAGQADEDSVSELRFNTHNNTEDQSL